MTERMIHDLLAQVWHEFAVEDEVSREPSFADAMADRQMDLLKQAVAASGGELVK